jgi:hypothetical protein
MMWSELVFLSHKEKWILMEKKNSVQAPEALALHAQQQSVDLFRESVADIVFRVVFHVRFVLHT